VRQPCQIAEFSNIIGLAWAVLIELQVFTKGVAVFCDLVQNCKIQQPPSPAFGNIKAQKGPYMKSTLADFTDGVDHDY